MEKCKLENSLPESRTAGRDCGTNSFKISALLIATSVSVLLTVCFAAVVAGRRQVSSPKLRMTINPNTASIESLARLPGIGAAKAGEIVSYRQKFQNENAGQTAFQNINDLKKVRTIGLKTIQNIYRFLDFQ